MKATLVMLDADSGKKSVFTGFNPFCQKLMGAVKKGSVSKNSLNKAVFAVSHAKIYSLTRTGKSSCQAPFWSLQINLPYSGGLFKLAAGDQGASISQAVTNSLHHQY